MGLDLVIVSVFLLANLAFGLFSGRNIKNIKEYTLGGRNFSTATIVATIAATWIGGSNFSITVAETHKQGIFFFAASLAEALSFCIIAYFYAPRMAEFLGKLSIAQIMGEMYNNNYIRCIISIFSIIPAVGRVAMQFLVLQCLLNFWLGVPGVLASVISSMVIISYSAFGGIRAVTFTDLIQFFTFGVVMPMVVFVIWKSVAGTDLIINTVIQDPLFSNNLLSNTQNQDFFNTFILFLFLMVPILDPAIFQRISMAKNTLQVSRSFFIAVFFIIICDGLVNTIIGVLFRADASIVELNADNVIQYVMDHYLNYGFKGVFIIGIMAMIMSTADSYINSSAVLLTNDFGRSFGIRLIERNQLLFVRISAVFIGLVALLLSLFAKNLLDLLLSVYSFYMPIVTLPFTLAILGFRSTTRALLVGIITGFVTVVYFEFFAPKSVIISGIPGTLVSFIFFLGTHYLLKEKGGWVGIKNRTYLDAVRLERKRKIHRFIQSIKSFSLIKFCQDNTPKEESMFVYFALFSIVVILSHAYALPKTLQEQHMVLLNRIYCSVLTISTIFITYTFWTEKFRNRTFISLLWNVSVFYNLAFTTSFLVILGQFNEIQIVVLMASLITVAVLMRWQIAMIMIVSGAILGIQCYKMYMGINVLPEYMSSLQFKITYSLLLLSSILIAFFKPKQQYQESTEERVSRLKDLVDDQGIALIKSMQLKSTFIKNLDAECIEVFKKMYAKTLELTDKLNLNSSKENVIAVHKELLEVTKKMTHVSEYLTDVINQVENFVKLNISEIDIEQLIYSVSDRYSKLNTIKLSVDLKTLNKNVICDPELIGYLIEQCINYVYSNDDDIIKVLIEDQVIEYALSFTKEYKKKVSGMKISIINEQKLNKASISNNIFEKIKKIIKAHYGNISINESFVSFTIPLNLNEVRPKTMDMVSLRVLSHMFLSGNIFSNFL